MVNHNDVFPYVTKIHNEMIEHELRRRQTEAAEKTATNIETANERLNKIIDNQNSYIELLEEQLEISKSQLQALKNLFVSLEDGVSVEKELAKIIQSQIDEAHPLWDYVKDKGGDIAVSGIVAGTPVLYNALRAFLIKQGIPLP